MGNKIDETFGQRVARLRVAADLTQDKLAAKAGLPVTSLRNYEHDHRRPRADAALRLARALGVTVEELLVLPSSRPARADVQDPPGLRALKRAWARANEDERRQFLTFVTQDTSHRKSDEGGLEGDGEATTESREPRNIGRKRPAESRKAAGGHERTPRTRESK